MPDEELSENERDVFMLIREIEAREEEIVALQTMLAYYKTSAYLRRDTDKEN